MACAERDLEQSVLSHRVHLCCDSESQLDESIMELIEMCLIL